MMSNLMRWLLWYLHVAERPPPGGLLASSVTITVRGEGPVSLPSTFAYGESLALQQSHGSVLRPRHQSPISRRSRGMEMSLRLIERSARRLRQ